MHDSKLALPVVFHSLAHEKPNELAARISKQTLLDAIARTDIELVDQQPHTQPQAIILHGSSTDDFDEIDAESQNLPRMFIEPCWPEFFDDMETIGPRLGRHVGPSDAVVTTDGRLVGALRHCWGETRRVIQLRPFLDISPWFAATRMRAEHRAAIISHERLDSDALWMVAVCDSLAGPALESLHVLLRALSRLPNEHWRLLVACPANVRAAWQAAAPLLAATRFAFCDYSSPLQRGALFAAADLLLWPGGGWTHIDTLLEAQATGLAVLACDETGVRDRVFDGVTGRVVQQGNAEDLAGAIRFLLAKRQFLTSYSTQAREQMTKHFDISIGANTIQQAVADLVARHTRITPEAKNSQAD